MSVSEMLNKMSAYEIACWMTYYKIQSDDEKNKQAQGGMLNSIKRKFKR